MVLTGHEGVHLTFTAQVSSFPPGPTKQTLFCPVRSSLQIPCLPRNANSRPQVIHGRHVRAAVEPGEDGARRLRTERAQARVAREDHEAEGPARVGPDTQGSSCGGCAPAAPETK